MSENELSHPPGRFAVRGHVKVTSQYFRAFRSSAEVACLGGRDRFGFRPVPIFISDVHQHLPSWCPVLLLFSLPNSITGGGHKISQ
jgi:hypothetical protein